MQLFALLILYRSLDRLCKSLDLRFARLCLRILAYSKRIVFPLCLVEGCSTSSKLAFSNTFDIRLFNSLITGSVSVSQSVFASLALAMDLAKDITSSIKSIVESFRSEQLFVRRFTARSIMPCGFLGRMLIALGACCNCKRIEFSSRSHVAMLHRFRLVFILFRVRLFYVEH